MVNLISQSSQLLAAIWSLRQGMSIPHPSKGVFPESLFGQLERQESLLVHGHLYSFALRDIEKCLIEFSSFCPFFPEGLEHLLETEQARGVEKDKEEEIGRRVTFLADLARCLFESFETRAAWGEGVSDWCLGPFLESELEKISILREKDEKFLRDTE